MKNKENHARTHEKQRTTMQKPIKHHEKNKEKPCKNQCKPRRNNENKCIHHTYPTFMYHLYSMSKWYIWYYFSYSENTFMMCIDTLYMLPVRRRTRGTEEIEEMRKQEDEETKRRRNEPYSWSYRGKNMLPVRRRTRGTEEIEEMRKQEDEETKRRRNEPLQLKLSGEKINAEWRLFLLRRLLRGSRVIFFFWSPMAQRFSAPFPGSRRFCMCNIFFDALNIFFLVLSQYFFLILLIFFFDASP